MPNTSRTIYASDGVRVEGLREFQTAIRQVSKDVAKQNRVQWKRIAEHVASVARGRMHFGSGSGGAATAVQGISSNAGAGIRFPAGGPGSGGDALGYYPWLDFGGGPRAGRGVTHSTGHGGGARRAVIKEGRYVYPAITASWDYILEQAGDIVADVGHQEGFEVR